MDELLYWLQKWFHKNCNGDWEHNKNITIETIDNPGWSIFINLEDTILENTKFSIIDIERTEDDWIYCIVKENKFQGACGPLNLIEILKIFRDWAEHHAPLLDEIP